MRKNTHFFFTRFDSSTPSCHAHPSNDTIAKRVDHQRTVTTAIAQHVLQYPDLLLQWVTLSTIILTLVSTVG